MPAFAGMTARRTATNGKNGTINRAVSRHRLRAHRIMNMSNFCSSETGQIFI
jgi:hypothetical protein